MALVQVNTTVGTSPTLLTTIPNGIGKVAIQIQNRDTAAISVGGPNVNHVAASGNAGLSIAAGSSLQIWLNGNDSIYAISAAGTTNGSVVVVYSGL